MVKNLGYNKKVSIWKKNRDGSWGDVFADWKVSFPGGFERWDAEASEGEHIFAVKYEDFENNLIYWDNNDGWNYKAPYVTDSFAVITGREFPIVHGQSTLINKKLRVHVAIQNLAYEKIVGLVYTTDNWKTKQTIYANYYWEMSSGIQVWLFEHDLSTQTDVEFALFYTVNGVTYWDNNFFTNYRVIPQISSIKKLCMEESISERWDIQVKKEIPQKAKKHLEPEPTHKQFLTEPELIQVGK
jgi:hypothetical protein